MAVLLPASLLEAACYLAAGFPMARAAFARAVPGASRQALLLAVSGLAPFLLLRAGSAAPLPLGAVALLAGLLGAVAFWYAVLPRRPAFDAGFLVIVAAPMVSHFFPRLYPAGDPALHIDIVGRLMWIRVTLLAFFVIRGWEGASPPGFWPSPREWRTGALWFVPCAVVLGVAAPLVHFAGFALLPGPWYRVAATAIGTFFGILWVVAFFEEAFCRGVLLPALLRAGFPTALAVVVSSLLFGTVHLWAPAHGQGFPNWPYFAVAAIAGAFYAMAYLRAGSTRASMVTHALTVTCWRLLFH